MLSPMERACQHRQTGPDLFRNKDTGLTRRRYCLWRVVPGLGKTSPSSALTADISPFKGGILLLMRTSGSDG